MAGLRVGYAIVPEGGPDLAPVLGVGAPALAGALWAVENGADAARRRRAQADAQRARLAAEFPVADGVGPLRLAGAAGGGRAGRAADLRRPGRRLGRRAARARHAARRCRHGPAAGGAAGALIQSSSVPPETLVLVRRAARGRLRQHRPPAWSRLHGAAGQRRRSAHVGGAPGRPRPCTYPEQEAETRLIEVRELRDAIFALLLAAARRGAGADRHREAGQRRTRRRRARPAAARRHGRARRPRRCRPRRRAARAHREVGGRVALLPRARVLRRPELRPVLHAQTAATSAGAGPPAAPAPGSRATLCVSDDRPGDGERLLDHEVGDPRCRDGVERQAARGAVTPLGSSNSGASGPSSSTISRPARRGGPLRRSASSA